MPSTEITHPPVIPDHQPIRCIGKGSYGDVWLARSVTGALHAVKVVSRKNFTDERPFDREFEGLQRFEPVSRTHPGLVNLLHIGRAEDNSSFFYVMEVADDLQTGPDIDPDKYVPKTLSQLLRNTPLPLEECVEIGLTLSDALTHLHRHELVHRDIKPSNIIFVNGVPRLADVGLVTSTGVDMTFVGTEGYIPPEGPGKPSADVYALGKVLYEASMGKSRSEFPELPTELSNKDNAAQFMRFNDLLVKACAEKPWQRFESADDLHSSLQGLKREFGFNEPGHGSVHPRSGHRLHLVFPAADQQQLLQILNQRLPRAGFRFTTSAEPPFSMESARDLERNIRASDILLLGLSNDSVHEEQTAYAAELATQAAHRPNQSLEIIAVRLKLSAPLPIHFDIALRTARFIDWTGPKDNDHLITTLQSA